MATKLTRPTEGRIIGGVCKGIADAFDVDVTIVRAITAVLVIAAGSGPLIYLVLWAIMPSEDSDRSLATDAASRMKDAWDSRNTSSAPKRPSDTFDPYEDN